MNTSKNFIQTSTNASDGTHQREIIHIRTNFLHYGFQMIETMPTCVISTEKRVHLSIHSRTSAVINACPYVQNCDDSPMMLQYLDDEGKEFIKKPASKEIYNQKQEFLVKMTIKFLCNTKVLMRKAVE